ncbi:MAG: ATP-binding cassette domain-containing protein [Thermoanaerobaculia bacterium]|nr:ATP-binding cassette domain-containing protein [Thermoanaerobaculia bacterium]
MISVSNLSKFFGHQTLFTDVSLQMTPGNRYGVVGANGSGKSTFLRILSGDEMASEGEVNIPKRLRVGVLKQDHFRYEEDRIVDVVMMGNAELWEAMQEREQILARAEEEFDADRYSVLEDMILAHDGYSAEARAGEILEGLGIPAEQHFEPLSILSGGFKLRVLLAQVLAAGPDALLLDEPTNHLDILSIRWLERFLQEFEGLVAVISHDHRFLDNVCNYILDVDYEEIRLYTGNYTDFVEGKKEERDRKEKEIEKQEARIAEHQRFIDRFKAKATKARQARSKQKQLERIEVESLAQTSRRYPTFQFKQRRPSGKSVAEVKGVSKAYDDNQVLHDVSIEVQRGDRLAILGPNGIGKSTLLKIMVGELAADAGEVEWGYETHTGYFAQDHKELFEGGESTIEGWIWDFCPGEPVGFVRGKLGLVLFTGEESKKKVSQLSGGESARLVFAKLGIQQPNVLLLDEPTNHLDLEAIEALVEGLRKFEGTLILVSHDRWFVSQLANRILEIRKDGLEDYRGTYEEYVQDCGDDHLDVENAVLKAKREKKKAARAAKSGPPSAGDQRELIRRKKDLERKRDRFTETIETSETRIHEINEIFCDPGYFDKADDKEVRKLEGEQKKLAEKVDEAMAGWEEIEKELADLEGQLASS